MSKHSARYASFVAMLMAPVVMAMSPERPVPADTTSIHAVEAENGVERGPGHPRAKRKERAPAGKAGAKQEPARRFRGVQVTSLPAGGVLLQTRGTALGRDMAPRVRVDGVPAEVSARGEIRGVSLDEITDVRVVEAGGSTGVFSVHPYGATIEITTSRGR